MMRKRLLHMNNVAAKKQHLKLVQGAADRSPTLHADVMVDQPMPTDGTPSLTPIRGMAPTHASL